MPFYKSYVVGTYKGNAESKQSKVGIGRRELEPQYNDHWDHSCLEEMGPEP